MKKMQPMQEEKMNEAKTLRLIRATENVYQRCNLRDGNTEGWFDNSGLSTIIAFRGTSKNRDSKWSLIRDIISDVNCLPKHHPELGWVPAGFLRAGLRIFDDVERRIFDKRKPIMVTGHSLGAAVALIVAGMLVSRGYNVSAVRGFGAPRVGKLKVLFGTSVRLFRYGGDAVCLIPFFSSPRKYDRTGPKRLFSIKDHFMKNYVSYFLGKGTN